MIRVRLVRDEVITISVVIETAGASRKEINVGLSTLERYVGALGRRLEIRAVLDDAETKLNA